MMDISNASTNTVVWIKDEQANQALLGKTSLFEFKMKEKFYLRKSSVYVWQDTETPHRFQWKSRS